MDKGLVLQTIDFKSLIHISRKIKDIFNDTIACDEDSQIIFSSLYFTKAKTKLV